LGVGYAGRTYGERWIVIDTEVLREWDGHDRLRFHCNPDRPTVDCPTPLGHHRWEYPARVGEDEEWLVTDEAVWNVLEDQGITREHVRILRAVAYSHHVRAADRWRVGRVFLAGDAAHAMPPWNGQGMSAGVRDAANLCWKLAAVVHGHAPQSILDSYQAERMPHVTEVTRRAVFAGRIITQRHRSVAALRDHLLRRLIRLPGAVEAFQKLAWIPDAHYGGGFLADQRHRAVGWQVPQPWLIDAAGAAVRLDDVLAGRWAVVHTGNLPAEAEKWLAHGVFSLRVLDPAAGPRPDGIRDSGGVLTKWMRDRKATALVLRPDGFVYAATDGASALPGPPSGLIPATQALPEPTTRSESTL
jgi:3-(3-hydroxy-phenyl)propionate hydroxylase